LTWEKPKNPNFLKKMDPEKPRKTQKPKNPGLANPVNTQYELIVNTT